MVRKRPTFDHAKACYVHRFTMEHVPSWAKREGFTVNGVHAHYAPQYRSDREWYDNTLFPGEPGHTGPITHCYSINATWPLGHSLPKPYRVEG